MRRTNEQWSQNLSENDRTLLERLIKQCDPNDVLMSSFTNLAQISDGEKSILSTIHKLFKAEAEDVKDVTLHQLKRLVAKIISGRAMESNLPTSQPILKAETCEEGEVENLNYEIVNLTPEQIEGYDLTHHEVTVEELYSDIENANLIYGLQQDQKEVVVSSEPLQSVTLPVEVRTHNLVYMGQNEHDFEIFDKPVIYMYI